MIQTLGTDESHWVRVGAHMLPVAVHARDEKEGRTVGCLWFPSSSAPISSCSYPTLLVPQQVWLLHQRAAVAHRSLNNSSGSDLRLNILICGVAKGRYSLRKSFTACSIFLWVEEEKKKTAIVGQQLLSSGDPNMGVASRKLNRLFQSMKSSFWKSFGCRILLERR
ncbi:hypothetical protein Q8A73_002694 [Channa argus]|nr:hypothetical protein Q8A73_002694 [Channa argus]